MLLVTIILFILSFALLALSSGWIVTSLSKLGRFFSLNEYTLGALVMAVATSLPELFIAIHSSLTFNSSLALGNVVGANIANLAFIGGITLLLSRSFVFENFLRKDTFHMFLIALLPLLFMFDRHISRFEGVVLLFVFVLYVWKLLSNKTLPLQQTQPLSSLEVFNAFALFGVSFLLLLGSSRFIVSSAKALSESFQVPPILIGLIVVSLGTTVPELAFSISAALKGHTSMAMGNLIGSVITNSTLVLGTAALLQPVIPVFFYFIMSGVFLFLIITLFSLFAYEQKIGWKEGLVLLLFYLSFVYVESSSKGLF